MVVVVVVVGSGGGVRLREVFVSLAHSLFPPFSLCPFFVMVCQFPSFTRPSSCSSHSTSICLLYTFSFVLFLFKVICSGSSNSRNSSNNSI